MDTRFHTVLAYTCCHVLALNFGPFILSIYISSTSGNPLHDPPGSPWLFLIQFMFSTRWEIEIIKLLFEADFMKRYILSFLLLALLFSGCQERSMVEPAKTASPDNQLPTNGFLKTRGRQIIDAGSGQPFRVQAVNFEHDPAPKDYVDANKLGFNAVRLTLNLEQFNGDSAYQWLEDQISSAKAANTYLILALAAPEDQQEFWKNPSDHQTIIAFWGEIADRYSQEQIILGYDLLHLPKPENLNQWQMLAQAICGNIRNFDGNHILIVQAALVPDRTFIYLDDSNYVLGFDFFKPFEFTTLDQGNYPSSSLFQPNWNDFRLTEYNNNPKLAPGTTDWTETAASLSLVVNRETVVGIPSLFCSNLLGTAWFGDFVIEEYDEQGQYLRDVQSVDMAKSSFWGPWSGDNSVLIEKIAESPWGSTGKSIRFSLLQDGQPASGTVADPAFAFEAIPGHSYKTYGWIRGDNVNPDADCRFNIEFYSYAGKDQLPIWDRDHLSRELERLSHYGAYHNLPVMVVEFGAVQATMGHGGETWVADMLDLMDGYSLNYAWKSYRDTSWGIYGGNDSVANQHLLSAFLRQENSKIMESADIQDLRPFPILVDGFIHAKGTELVVGSLETPIQLMGINFNNDLYNPDFRNSTHHARRDFFEVRQLGFNVIRFNITHSWFTESPDLAWDWLDQQVRWANEAGVYLIINIHYVPGQNDWSFYYGPDEQQQTADLWKTLASRYKDETIIAGYDLLNEPHQIDPDTYQTYMQKVVDAIREVDTNHLIIVEAINSYTPEFVMVDDDNIMYDFHFYHPIDLTHENTGGSVDTGTYPDDTFLEIRWDGLNYLGAPRTPRLPVGRTDWVLYESSPMQPRKSEATKAFGMPKLFCNQNTGKAYFGDFQVMATDESGNSKVLIDQSIDAETVMFKGSERDGVIFGLGPENPGHVAGGRSITVQDSDRSAWVEFTRDTFEVQPGVQYQIKGWMRGDDVSSGADCYYLIEFFQLAPGDVLLRHDRDFLLERLMVGIAFREQHNVPINVGEFGVFQTTFLSENAGGAAWIQDMLELLIENKINFAYWDYHGSWGLYTDFWHYPDPADINGTLADRFYTTLGK